MIEGGALSETNMAPANRWYSNHPFSVALLLSGRVSIWMTSFPLQNHWFPDLKGGPLLFCLILFDTIFFQKCRPSGPNSRPVFSKMGWSMWWNNPATNVNSSFHMSPKFKGFLKDTQEWSWWNQSFRHQVFIILWSESKPQENCEKNMLGWAGWWFQPSQ